MKDQSFFFQIYLNFLMFNLIISRPHITEQGAEDRGVKSLSQVHVVSMLI